ncbi:dipeptide/oligopeptide/nickel ABC transporter ATP-binding protein, partial [bacterium]|nr:dipeptide/oligopeptide/nickel ABC transporter ATP-binding protein [bacterium]
VVKIFRRSGIKSFLQTDTPESQVFRAVDDVSLGIGEGEVVGLVGRTGCGKSTLARIAVRLIAPDSGAVLYGGESVHELKNEKLRNFRHRIRMLFQDPSASLNPHMTVFRIVEEPIKLYTSLAKMERRIMVSELLNEVNLYGFEKKYPHELSGGEKRRVSLARGLSMDPKLVIADEVSSGLDSSTKQQIMNILSRRNEENSMAILLISHDLRLVRQWCRRIEVMERGKIVESLMPDQTSGNNVHHPFTRELLDAILEIE